MKITSKQYATALFDLVREKKGKELEQTIISFVKLLTERNDHFRLDKIIIEFESLWYKEKQVVKVEIESARELDSSIEEGVLERIKEVTKAKELLLLNKLNQDIIAGAVIKFNDQILDFSLKTRLRKFKESLSL